MIRRTYEIVAAYKKGDAISDEELETLLVAYNKVLEASHEFDEYVLMRRDALAQRELLAEMRLARIRMKVRT